jgi:hypothetical protein
LNAGCTLGSGEMADRIVWTDADDEIDYEPRMEDDDDRFHNFFEQLIEDEEGEEDEDEDEEYHGIINAIPILDT